jgi:Zn-dependent protease
MLEQVLQSLGYSSPEEFLALLLAMVVGLTVHEYCHARVAFQLGDLTAYLQGRLTLDPRKHLDPFGMLMMLVVHFGWAKPVPVDPYRLGRRGMLLVAVAGPLSNVGLALLAGLPFRFSVFSLAGGTETVEYFFMYFAYFNILLAVFNMLPIPPLDGWKVLMGLVPESTAVRLSGFEQYGFMVLLGILLVGAVGGGSLLWTVMSPFVTGLTWLVFGGPVGA